VERRWAERSTGSTRATGESRDERLQWVDSSRSVMWPRTTGSGGNQPLKNALDDCYDGRHPCADQIDLAEIFD
jgi:hypothetical protein